jgi:hypothetical protein
MWTNQDFFPTCLGLYFQGYKSWPEELPNPAKNNLKFRIENWGHLWPFSEVICRLPLSAIWCHLICGFSHHPRALQADTAISTLETIKAETYSCKTLPIILQILRHDMPCDPYSKSSRFHFCLNLIHHTGMYTRLTDLSTTSTWNSKAVTPVNVLQLTKLTPRLWDLCT